LVFDVEDVFEDILVLVLFDLLHLLLVEDPLELLVLLLLLTPVRKLLRHLLSPDVIFFYAAVEGVLQVLGAEPQGDLPNGVVAVLPVFIRLLIFLIPFVSLVGFFEVEDDLVELFVVVVVELHGADPLEGDVPWGRRGLIRVGPGHLLEQLRGVQISVRIQLFVLLELADPLELVVGVFGGTDVGLAQAVLSSVAALLAAGALQILVLHLLLLVLVLLLLLIILALMFRKLTSWRIFFGLAATPPHLTPVLTPVSPTGPVVVLVLKVLLPTILTQFLVQIHISPPFHFLDLRLQLFSFNVDALELLF